MLKWFGSCQNFSFTPYNLYNEVTSRYEQGLLIIFNDFVLFALCVEQNKINLIKGNIAYEFLERQGIFKVVFLTSS